MEKKKTKEAPIMHGFDAKKTTIFTKKVIIILLVVAFFGVGTGYLLAASGGGGNSSVVGKLVNKSAIPAGKTFGDGDEAIFKDNAEGVVKEGGVEGEGQYHLVRPGGDSQNVYMTSSTVDLSQFVDRKIKVWGQTQKAEKVGWLMDVGKIEVLE